MSRRMAGVSRYRGLLAVRKTVVWHYCRAKWSLFTPWRRTVCSSSLRALEGGDTGTDGPIPKNTIIDMDILEKLVPNLDDQDPRDTVVTRGPVPRNVTVNSYKDLPIIHVMATHNNTIFTITDASGRVLAWTSAGAEGFRNARRGTAFAAQTAATAAAKKALALGLRRFQVKLKGTGPGRGSLKGLEVGGVAIESIQDVTPIPHNGCKPRKARRL